MPDNLTEILNAESEIGFTTPLIITDNIPEATGENIERIPSEIAESEGSNPDLLFSEEAEITNTTQSIPDESEEGLATEETADIDTDKTEDLAPTPEPQRNQDTTTKTEAESTTII